MGNLEKVRQIYAAFGRGNIPAILTYLAPDVAWEYGMGPNDVPWLQPRHGRAEVAKFFEAFGALDFHQFEPKTFLESGPLVVALIDVALTVKATGRRITEEHEVHLWHFNAAGQVSRFAHKVDTHQHWSAYHGAPREAGSS